MTNLISPASTRAIDSGPQYCARCSRMILDVAVAVVVLVFLIFLVVVVVIVAVCCPVCDDGFGSRWCFGSRSLGYTTRTPQFRVVFVSQWWTRFELAWFYFWTTTTLLVMFLPGIGFFSVAARNGLRWVSSQPCGGGPYYPSFFCACAVKTRVMDDRAMPSNLVA